MASAKRDSEELSLPLEGAACAKVLRHDRAECALSVVLKCKHVGIPWTAHGRPYSQSPTPGHTPHGGALIQQVGFLL